MTDNTKRIFSAEQLLGIAGVLTTDATRARAMKHLHDKWKIRMLPYVHDEWVLEVPDTLTKEDGDIIYTELMVLVR